MKEDRNQILLSIQKEISLRKNRRRIGDEVQILVEGLSKMDDTKWTGRTDQNLIVHFPAGRDLVGRLVRVRLVDCTPLCFFAELV